MRYLLPVVAAATALTIGIAPAAASSKHDHQPRRVESHVRLPLSGTAVSSDNILASHVKVRPSGRHRVKVVFRGPDAEVVATTTDADGTFALRWSPDRIGNYAARAFGVHDRRSRGPG